MRSSSPSSRGTASATTAGPEPKQCWECLRRRWVCDSSRPVCNKCRAAGIVCPGYNDQKPLTWLAPGRVTSRTRRRTQQPSPQRHRRIRSDSDSPGSLANPKSMPKGRTAANRRNESAMEAVPTSTLSDSSSKHVVVPGATFAGSSDCNGGGGPTSVSSSMAVVSLAPISNSALDMRSDTSDVVEAVQYYNIHIYPNFAASQLAPNPFVARVVDVHSFPSSIRHTLVSMALSHRILQHRLGRGDRPSITRTQAGGPAASESSDTQGYGPMGSPEGLGKTVTGHNWTKISTLDTITVVSSSNPSLPAMSWRLHHHTGLAIRALNEEIAKESTRSSDATIMSVMVFLMAEIQHSISPHWRPHVDGLMALIMLRGGFKSLVKSAVHLRPMLLYFTIVAVIANTTSPASNQIITTAHPQMSDIVKDLYSVGVFPTLPCPEALFLSIVQINYLRLHAASSSSAALEESGQTNAIFTILEDIKAFSPESWPRSSGLSAHPEEGLCIARIFQSAVALYAATALRPCPNPAKDNTVSASFMSASSLRHDLDMARQHHYNRLFSLLEPAMKSSIVRKTMAWPLVVAGVASVSGTGDERAFVRSCLSEMSLEAGISSPLVAVKLLEAFWASGKTEWNSCFDRPYAILV